MAISEAAGVLAESTTRRSKPPTEQPEPSSARVRKRSGAFEALDATKIKRAIERAAVGLSDVDPDRIAAKVATGIFDGATTQELDQLAIQTAAALTAEEPNYARLAARLLSVAIDKEIRSQDIQSFSQSVTVGHKLGLFNDRVAAFVQQNARKLNDAVVPARDREFEYFGLRTVYDRYLSKHPKTRLAIETPQFFFLRTACALTETLSEALELYGALSSLDYLPSSPTLFNAGSAREQLSSCFLLDSPTDDLQSIYQKYSDVAMLTQYSGGIGLAYHRVRARGSLIKGTNGHSQGIVPWIKTLDVSVAAVSQASRRKGACCVYLEPWHADIEDFLDLRNSTGDEASRVHNINLANWVPDLFMKRMEEGGDWSLFDPKEVPILPDLYGLEFEHAYVAAERAGKAVRTVKARDLYAKMMRTLAQTGNGWMNFKDKANRACNQTAVPGQTVHLSNLCTEILEISSAGETAVCNLASINLARHVANGGMDWDKLAQTVRLAVRQLDRVIDLNFYPIGSALNSNMRWRPVGLGLMGLQDVFFMLGLPFDSAGARELSKKISEEIYFHALSTSVELAQLKGEHEAFGETRTAQGELQFDAWGVTPTNQKRWDKLRALITEHGLRNSLLIAIAPTATIASIAGCFECIEPQISNLFKRETLSGDFLQINRYLVNDLKKLGLWDDEMRSKLKMAEGSIQAVISIPAEIRQIYRTAWELPMRSLIDMAADRGAFIDQSQSLNLFIENPNIGQLSSMYFYAWKQGLKTTYYLRSRPATKIGKATVDVKAPVADAAAVTCSLESPESCDACQ